MKKFNINSKGFTLIELLAVITILGILMLVAIPNVTRTIENSRRDTFADLAKQYINTVRNAVLADELKCGTNATSVGATGDGTYYFQIDSAGQVGTSNDLMENSSKSPWSSSDVVGFVSWTKETKTTSNPPKTTTTYSILLVDNGKHGIMDKDSKKSVAERSVAESSISRTSVSTHTEKSAGELRNTVTSLSGNVCTLK